MEGTTISGWGGHKSETREQQPFGDPEDLGVGKQTKNFSTRWEKKESRGSRVQKNQEKKWGNRKETFPAEKERKKRGKNSTVLTRGLRGAQKKQRKKNGFGLKGRGLGGREKAAERRGWPCLKCAIQGWVDRRQQMIGKKKGGKKGLEMDSSGAGQKGRSQQQNKKG